MFKKVVHRYLTLLMALLVLTSSAGIGLVEHECMVKGKSVELVFNNTKKGCKLCRTPKKEATPKSDPTTPVFKKVNCCIEKQQIKAVEYQVTLKKSDDQKATRDLTPAILPSSHTFESVSHDFTAEWELRPPPAISFTSLYYGRAMLSFAQQFLI